MLSFIFWTLGGIIVGAIIGGIIGDFLGDVAVFVYDLLDLIPIPTVWTHLIAILGSCALVWYLCDDRLWFGVLVAWWAFYITCVKYGHEASGGW